MRKILFLMFVFALWPFNLTAAQEPITAEVVPDRLNIRATPNGEIIGELTRGTVVEILGQEDIQHNGGFWLYVRTLDNAITGWVDKYYLRFPSNVPREYVTQHDLLPVPTLLSDERVLNEPIQAAGVITGYISCDYYRFDVEVNVYAEPSEDSTIATLVGCYSVFAIYGRTDIVDLPSNPSHLTEWVYVEQLNGSARGWIWGADISFPRLYDPRTLPILEPIASPNLVAPTIQPIDRLEGVTYEYAGLRHEPATVYSVFYPIPENTPVTLIGRNANTRFVKVIVDGYVGWIFARHINIVGDPNRLPILSMKGSYWESSW